MWVEGPVGSAPNDGEASRPELVDAGPERSAPMGAGPVGHAPHLDLCGEAPSGRCLEPRVSVATMELAVAAVVRLVRTEGLVPT